MEEHITIIITSLRLNNVQVKYWSISVRGLIVNRSKHNQKAQYDKIRSKVSSMHKMV